MVATGLSARRLRLGGMAGLRPALRWQLQLLQLRLGNSSLGQTRHVAGDMREKAASGSCAEVPTGCEGIEGTGVTFADMWTNLDRPILP